MKTVVFRYMLAPWGCMYIKLWQCTDEDNEMRKFVVPAEGAELFLSNHGKERFIKRT